MCTEGIRKPSSWDSFCVRPDPRQQLPALVAVDQRDQPVADFQADHVHRGDVVPTQFLTSWALRRQQLLLALHLLLGDPLGLVLPVPDPVGGSTGQGAEADEGNVRHARHGAHGDQDRRGNRQRLGRGEHLPVDLLAHVPELETRVTMIAAAVDSSSDGSCATRPSPMVSRA